MRNENTDLFTLVKSDCIQEIVLEAWKQICDFHEFEQKYNLRDAMIIVCTLIRPKE